MSDDRPGYYFTRLSETLFQPSPLTGGAWNSAEQHVAPLFGLLAHAVEREHLVRRDDPLALARVSYDILGVLTLEPFDVHVSVMRAGRTIELVEASAVQGGRTAVTARAWLSAPYDTAALEGSALSPIAPPERMASYDPGEIWDGGFIRSVEVRRQALGAGRAAWWCRIDNRLVADEAVSQTAAALGVLDLANGVAPRVSPQQALFPNLDLTVHLFRAPAGPWIGFDTSVSIGASGLGLTHSILHDGEGPVGSIAQMLTVRPRHFGNSTA